MKTLCLLFAFLFAFSCASPSAVKREIASLGQIERLDLTLESLKGVKNKNEFITKAKKLGTRLRTQEGILEVTHVDDLDREKSSDSYYLIDGREQIPLDLINKDSFTLQNSGIAEVILTEDFNTEGKQVAFINNYKKNISAVHDSPQKMLLLFFEFKDSLPIPTHHGDLNFSPQKFANTLNNGYFSEFFIEMFGFRNRSVVTRTEEWHYIDANCSEYPYSSYYSDKLGYIDSQKLLGILEHKGIDPNDFDNITYLSNCTGGRLGIAQTLHLPSGKRITTTSNLLNAEDFYLDDLNHHHTQPTQKYTVALSLLLHERGHNYGLPHSNGLDCGDKRIKSPGGCTLINYGNAFDVMGKHVAAHYLSAEQLRRNDLRDPSKFLEIKKEGVYTIYNLSNKEKGQPIGAYVSFPYSKNPIFMFEYRAPGFSLDSYLEASDYETTRNGLQVYSSLQNSSTYYSWGSTFNLLNAKPYVFRAAKEDRIEPTLYSFNERVRKNSINIDNPFFDPISGLFVEVLQVYPDEKIQFRVSFKEDKKECYIANLRDFIGTPFIEKEGESTSKKLGKVKLKAGDVFSLYIPSRKGAPDICPREQLKAKIISDTFTDAWFHEDSDGEGTGPFSGKRNTNLEIIFQNKNTNTLLNKFKVPENAALGEYSLELEYTNMTRTREKKPEKRRIIFEVVP